MQQLTNDTTLQGGKYIIARVLGQGGFGITYLAENVMLSKKVAIKEFFPKDFCDRDNTSHLTLGTQNNAETVSKLKSRFIKEAQNIAKLDHPGIVRIHDIFEENNTAYYVMEYIEGENLNEIVKKSGPLPEDKAVDYIVKVGKALSYIHSRNMTHFDVKPANIVVRSSDGMPILIDFGLSKQYDAKGDATSTLLQGVSTGFSPLEVYNPNGLNSFSPQTDIYSLGATLSFLLTGNVPPPAMELVSDSLQLPQKINPFLKRAIITSMKPNKIERGKSIEDFLSSLGKSRINEALVEVNGQVNSLSEETNILSNEPLNSESRTPITPIPPINSIGYDSEGKNPSTKDSKSITKWIILGGISIAVLILTIIITTLINNTNNNGKEILNPISDSYNYGNDTAQMSDFVIDSVTSYTEDTTPKENNKSKENSTYTDNNSNSERNYYSDDQTYVDDSYTSGKATSSWGETINRSILNSQYRIIGNNKVHFYKGNFNHENTLYPVMLAFFQSGTSIKKVIYKNVNYKTKVTMSYKIREDEVILYGKAGGQDFTIIISSSSGNELEGTATRPSKSMPAEFWPTDETFQF